MRADTGPRSPRAPERGSLPFQRWGVAVVGGFSLAYVLRPTFDLLFAGLVLVSAVAIGGTLGWLARMLASWQVRADGALERELGSSLRGRIERLTVGEARERVAAILADPERYAVAPAAGSSDEAEMITRLPLPESARLWFELYRRVSAVRGDAVVDLRMLGPSTDHPGYVKVGEDIEFTSLVVDADGRLFEVEPGESLDDAARYPSVFHWLIAYDDNVYGGGGLST